MAKPVTPRAASYRPVQKATPKSASAATSAKPVVAKPLFSSSVSHVSHGDGVAVPAASPQPQASALRSATSQYFPGRVVPGVKPSPFKANPSARSEAGGSSSTSSFGKAGGFVSTSFTSSGDASHASHAQSQATPVTFTRPAAQAAALAAPSPGPVYKHKAASIVDTGLFSSETSGSSARSSSYSSLSSPTFSAHPTPSSSSASQLAPAPATHFGYSSLPGRGLAKAAVATASPSPSPLPARPYPRLIDEQTANAVLSDEDDDFEEDEEGFPRFAPSAAASSAFRAGGVGGAAGTVSAAAALEESEQARFEDERGPRGYRHGTSSNGERSFVEVGMGGYPDGAYEYVEAPEQTS